MAAARRMTTQRPMRTRIRHRRRAESESLGMFESTSTTLFTMFCTTCGRIIRSFGCRERRMQQTQPSVSATATMIALPVRHGIDEPCTSSVRHRDSGLWPSPLNESGGGTAGDGGGGLGSGGLGGADGGGSGDGDGGSGIDGDG